MEHVEPEQHEDIEGSDFCRSQVHVEASPLELPGARVLAQQILEPGRPLQSGSDRSERLRNRVVSGRIERDDLLDAQRLALSDIDGKLLSDVPRFLDHVPLGVHRLTCDGGRRPGRLCHVKVGL